MAFVVKLLDMLVCLPLYRRLRGYMCCYGVPQHWGSGKYLSVYLSVCLSVCFCFFKRFISANQVRLACHSLLKLLFQEIIPVTHLAVIAPPLLNTSSTHLAMNAPLSYVQFHAEGM